MLIVVSLIPVEFDQLSHNFNLYVWYFLFQIKNKTKHVFYHNFYLN
jgi:hypothetical protein